LEAQAAAEEASTSQAIDVSVEDDGEEAVELGSETEDDEDDVEIIMEPQSRSLDFRQSSGGRPPPVRSTSTSAPLRAQPSLTTEYTPIQRAGAGAVPYRARGLRGARGFPGRGRGRGYGGDVPPPPVRPTSPLPPNVPTGPRNQNKYKDRDGNAPAVDGLDYGGGKDGRTTSGEPEDRSRKRRSSPGLDDVRGSKRR